MKTATMKITATVTDAKLIEARGIWSLTIMADEYSCYVYVPVERGDNQWIGAEYLGESMEPASFVRRAAMAAARQWVRSNLS